MTSQPVPSDSPDSLPSDPATSSFSTWLRSSLWSLRHVWRDVVLASVLLNLFVLASPLYIMNVYDRVVPNQAEETLWVLTLGLVLVLVFDLVIRLARHRFIELSGRQLEQSLSEQLFRHLLKIRDECLPASVGVLASRVREFDAIRQLFSASSFAAFTDFPFALIFLFVIWMVGGALVAIPLLVIGLMLIVAVIVHLLMQPQVSALQMHNAEKNAVLVETLTSLDTVKAFCAQARQSQRWADAVTQSAQSAVRVRQLSDTIPLVCGFLAQLAVAAVVVAGVYQIMQQQLSLGGLIASVLLTGRALASATQLINLLNIGHQARQAHRALQALTQLPVEKPLDRQWLAPAEIRGDIEIRHMGFAYGSASGVSQPLLHDINLHIRPGEKVALIGRIGSGKSTLLKLIKGALRPTSGQITLDGIGLDHIDPDHLRQVFAWVPQDIALIRGTLRDNVALKHPAAADAEILGVLAASGLAEFVAAHPMGLDMPIGEQGRGLSGGQRQGIAIARALLHQPSVFLFDELTSAMDNQSEQWVLEQMRQRAADITLILCTHRTALLALVERVIVLDHGRIVADGPKAEVLDALKRGLVGAKS